MIKGLSIAWAIVLSLAFLADGLIDKEIIEDYEDERVEMDL